MKYLNQLILALIISMVGLSSLHAQDINRDRMQRDINIMESVLEEMFKSTWENRGNNIQVFRLNDDEAIQGIYLKDYGLLFNVRGGTPSVVTILRSRNTEQKSSSANTDEEVSKEDIIKRITEFLGDYGSTVGQLSNEDKITVIFNADINRSAPAYTLLSDPQGDVNVDPNTTPFPKIHVTATKADLQAYREGSFDEEEFSNALSVKTINDENSSQDLNVMSNILKTAFEDTEVGEFEIDDAVDNIYLDGLGALFTVNASFNGSLLGILARLGQKFSGSISIDSLKMESSSNDDDGDTAKKMKELKKKKKESYQRFLLQLKETIVDYGRTLKSVSSEEYILVSVSISNSRDSLPEGIDLQVKKSVLQSIDSGQMSREQAMEQITVREY